MLPQKRKKWTEAEEKTLIEKYGEMVSNGTLAKMKTREKKFRPIALYVNSVHHVHDSVAFPWQWTWKDVSTKVQNMRHQYLLVKQKIKKPENSGGVEDCGGNGDEFDWAEGLTHWANFLLYKEVFGDLPAACGTNGSSGNELMGNFGEGMELVVFGQEGNPADGDFVGIDGGENGVTGLGFDYEGEEAEEHCNGNDRTSENLNTGFACEEAEPVEPNLRRKKKKALKGLEKRVFGFLSNQLTKLREMEVRFEQREVERERERQRNEDIRMAREQEWERNMEERENEREEKEKSREEKRRKITQKWEAIERENEERERRRKEEELINDKEWEDRTNRERLEWKKRMDRMLSQHREEMEEIQTRILHEQQNLTSQLLGMVTQWTGHPAGLLDHTSGSNHYISQMMHNLHHVNNMGHEDTRVDADVQGDQFIVDG